MEEVHGGLHGGELGSKSLREKHSFIQHLNANLAAPINLYLLFNINLSMCVHLVFWYICMYFLPLSYLKAS